MPQMKKQCVGPVMDYAIAFTSAVWATVLLDPTDRRSFMFGNRLSEVFQAVIKVNNECAAIRQVHFELDVPEHKEGSVALTLRFMDSPEGVPYLLLSLQGEPVEG
ncbi:hypothetical protein AB3464_04600 [Pseudomonas asplenii]|uniref:hypothetical protein n=1 Tax=Pseudomonas asplenii TaxID=53407 RepID=UPI0037CAC984